MNTDISKLPTEKEMQLLENSIIAADSTLSDIILSDLRKQIININQKIRKYKSLNDLETKKIIWTTVHNNFKLGGDLDAPISTVIEVLDKIKIKGFEFFHLKLLRGQLEFVNLRQVV